MKRKTILWISLFTFILPGLFAQKEQARNPTTLLIDTEGRLAKKYVGAMPEEILRADPEKLLKPKSSASDKQKPLKK